MNQIKLFWQRISSQQGAAALKTAYAEVVIIVGLVGAVIAAWKAKNISVLGTDLQSLFEGVGALAVAARFILSSNAKVDGSTNGGSGSTNVIATPRFVMPTAPISGK